MVAIKNWFLEKNDCKGFYGKEIIIMKETEKAILGRIIIEGSVFDQWFPKSVVINEWEKDTSNFGYHEYLVNVYHKAYEEKVIENYTFKSGRNTYRGDNFIHQETSKKIMEMLKAHNISFMNRTEWNNR